MCVRKAVVEIISIDKKSKSSRKAQLITLKQFNTSLKLSRYYKVLHIFMCSSSLTSNVYFYWSKKREKKSENANHPQLFWITKGNTVFHVIIL
jgi:hypothetical protein